MGGWREIQTGTEIETETETERERERQGDAERDRERQRKTERDRERQRATESDRERRRRRDRAFKRTDQVPWMAAPSILWAGLEQDPCGWGSQLEPWCCTSRVSVRGAGSSSTAWSHG